MMRIADDTALYDAVIIIRGGGSQSDLSCFNNYLLCSYIAQFPLPILTGIGHNKDQSVADMVAHTSLKTPTAVANFLIDTKREFEDLLDSLHGTLIDLLSYHLTNERKHIESLISNLRLAVIECTSREKIKIERIQSSLKNSSQNLIREKAHMLTLYENKIESANPQRILQLGYSMVTHNGKVVRRSDDVAKGDNLKIIVSDGTINSIVV